MIFSLWHPISAHQGAAAEQEHSWKYRTAAFASIRRVRASFAIGNLVQVNLIPLRGIVFQEIRTGTREFGNWMLLGGLESYSIPLEIKTNFRDRWIDLEQNSRGYAISFLSRLLSIVASPGDRFFFWIFVQFYTSGGYISGVILCLTYLTLENACNGK